MNTLINLAAKYSGLGFIWEKVDGAKTYIAAAASILSGAAGLLQEFLAVEGKHDFSALLAFAKDLPQDNCWLMILAGMGAIGLRHSMEKAAQSLAPSPAPAAQPPSLPKP